MKIYDKNDELLALLLDFNKIEDSKYFATENSQELQVASFKLNKDEEILRHIHPPQDRNIKTTSEVIIVLEGEIGHKPTWFSKFKKSNNIYDLIILLSKN